jgi:hypothetical protein
MGTLKSSATLMPKTNIVMEVPGILRVNQTLTVNAAVITIFSAGDGTAWVLDFINRSVAGVNIRIGLNPSFVPVNGLLLAPGDTYRTPLCWLTDWRAIASAAGGVLDIAGYWYPVQ